MYGAKAALSPIWERHSVRSCMVGPDRALYEALVQATSFHDTGVTWESYSPYADEFSWRSTTDMVLLESVSAADTTATLRRWQDEGHRTKVLIVADDSMGRWPQWRMLGAVYWLRKPVDVYVVLRRIRQFGHTHGFWHGSLTRYSSIRKPQEAVVQILDRLHMPSHISGYRYFVTAGMMLAGRPGATVFSMSALYEAIAEKHHVRPGAVERAMRYALEATWLEGDMEAIHDMFGYTVSPEKGKPTNGLFVRRLADYVRLTDGARGRIGGTADQNNNGNRRAT